jgi:hypothetical protein
MILWIRSRETQRLRSSLPVGRPHYLQEPWPFLKQCACPTTSFKKEKVRAWQLRAQPALYSGLSRNQFYRVLSHHGSSETRNHPRHSALCGAYCEQRTFRQPSTTIHDWKERKKEGKNQKEGKNKPFFFFPNSKCIVLYPVLLLQTRP